ncbi:MAG TPA: hypothetical protein VKY92_15205 [Verrucomicrobiae bacterium]|nr:hypothetical protein [Verrucomicrobiae bacterium]
MNHLIFKRVFLCALLVLSSATSWAALINVTTNDNYTKIESAGPGDEVVIAGGTYRFRVYLTGQGSPTKPIVIRALDPAHPPVWDFGSTLVENAPGSYTAGDRGRGGWQFSGAANYTISGIVFKHCRTASFNSAGIRYYYGTTNLYIKDCVFIQNDNGLTGGTQYSQATVEFCEFNANGNTNASSSSPTHNIYVYGGDLTMRYCYVHDSVQGQNFHIRCSNSTLEYNWFARANNYDGDLMSDDDFSAGGTSGPFSQTMVLRGNVFVQNKFPGNHSQVVALYNDAGLTKLTMNLRMLYNTFVGANTNSAFVHVSNADATQMNAEISDNIIYGTKVPLLIEDTNAATVIGSSNWLQTNATASPLTNSVKSADPGFRNVAAQDYTLASNSACIGAAGLIYGLPGREYFQNEITNRQWRPRATARDIGAFESTTAGGVGVSPYAAVPAPQLGINSSNGNIRLLWSLYAQDFSLQQSPTLTPAFWTRPSILSSTNLNGVSAVAPAVASAFLRLAK